MFPYINNNDPLKKPLKTEVVSTVPKIKNNSKNNAKDNQKPSNKPHSNISNNSCDNDDNIFSVNSLIYFLEDFLEHRLSSKLQNSEPENISTNKPWIKTDHSNMNEKPYIPPKKAAIAYAHGAEVIQANIKASDNNKHHNENISDIYHLLRDLRDLRDDGISKIKLGKNGTFIDSIHSAVQIAKISYI